MKLSGKCACAHRSSQTGFSLVELILSLVVLLIITTLAVPVIIRSLQSYQLNSAASQLSGMLKFAKFEGIRQNLPVSCQVTQQGTNWLVWVDSNGNGIPDPTEAQMVVGGTLALLSAASVPDTSSITATLGPGSTSMTLTVVPSGSTSETYDHRGVMVFTGAPTIYAIYLGNPNDANSGYRAVITLPSGAVQVWSSSSTGPWQRVS